MPARKLKPVAKRGRKLTPPPKVGSRPHGLRELAGALDIPYAKARRLRQDGLQARPDGTFDLRDAQRFLAERGARGAAWANQDPETLAIKKRHLLAKAMLEEMEVSERYKRLIDKADVQTAWRTRMVTLKNALKHLGRELAPRVAHRGPMEVQSIIDQRILELLRAISHPEYTPDAAVHH